MLAALSRCVPTSQASPFSTPTSTDTATTRCHDAIEIKQRGALNHNKKKRTDRCDISHRGARSSCRRSTMARDDATSPPPPLLQPLPSMTPLLQRRSHLARSHATTPTIDRANISPPPQPFMCVVWVHCSSSHLRGGREDGRNATQLAAVMLTASATDTDTVATYRTSF
jgi:hypothetical protein